MTSRRPDSFYLALVIAVIHALLLVVLIVVVWRTNAVLLFRQDSNPPLPSRVLPSPQQIPVNPSL
jgi:hypothetical protein